MIRRELNTQVFVTTNKTAEIEQIGYEKPELNTIGTAQKLVQGAWCTGYYDGWWNSYGRD